MSEEQEQYDAETGEVADELPLSVRAANGIQPPKYWRHVEAIEGEGGPNYEEAFWLAQGEIEAIIEADAQNPHLKSKYATLAGLLARIRPVLKKHKLTIKQYPGRIHKLSSDTAKHLFMPLCTTLRHVPSGEFETFVWEMPILKLDAQAIGSAASYARRYAVLGIFGIASVDDDGAAAAIRNSIEKSQGADVVESLIAQINECKTTADLIKWVKANREGIELFSDDKVEKLRAAYEARKEALQKVEADTAQLDIERDALAASETKKGRK